MSETRPRLTIMTIFSFLCVLVFAVSSSVQADSGEMIDLKGTGSAGSFSYGEDSTVKKSQLLDTELIIANPKVARENLIHMVRRAIQVIFLEVIVIKNPRVANQNHILTENRVTGKVTMAPRVVTENLTVIRNPREVNQSHILTENRVTGKVTMAPRVVTENLTVIRNPRVVNQNHIHTENRVTGKVTHGATEWSRKILRS